MKITKRQLRKLVQEELSHVMNEQGQSSPDDYSRHNPRPGVDTTTATARTEREKNYGMQRRIGGRQTAGWDTESMHANMDKMVQLAEEIAERVGQFQAAGQAEYGDPSIGSGFDSTHLDVALPMAEELANLIKTAIEAHSI